MLNSNNTNFMGFTGHSRDKDTGLNYMQARFYDPVIGRFLATDPIGYQDQFNLYSYVYNDPINNWDPTGECGETFSEKAQIAGACVVGGGVAAAAAAPAGAPGCAAGPAGCAAGAATVAVGPAIAGCAAAAAAMCVAQEAADAAEDAVKGIGGTEPGAAPPYDDVEGEVTINPNIPGVTQTEGRGEVQSSPDIEVDDKSKRRQEEHRVREEAYGPMSEEIAERAEEIYQPDPTEDGF